MIKCKALPQLIKYLHRASVTMFENEGSNDYDKDNEEDKDVPILTTCYASVEPSTAPSTIPIINDSRKTTTFPLQLGGGNGAPQVSNRS